MYNFQNRFSESRKNKTNNTVKNAIVEPFPKLSQEAKDKLAYMYDTLLGLKGRTYSSLSLNEKRLVEMFCKRYPCTSRGGDLREETSDSFTVLRLGTYAHYFLIKALEIEYFPMPKFTTFHILEDKRMNIDDLYGDKYEYTGSPFHDALYSFPNNYLPVRSSNGRFKVMGVFKGSTTTDLEGYVFKERNTVIPNEALYKNPYLGIKKEEPKIEEPEETPVHPYLEFIKAVNTAVVCDIMGPVAAAFVNRYLEIPNEFHKIYETDTEITEAAIELAKGVPTDTEAYKTYYNKLV